MSSVDAMGPGVPSPAVVTQRARGQGQPLRYQARGNRVQADVAKGAPGVNTAVSFQPRPPVRSPGGHGLGDRGTFVDAKA